MSERDEFEAIRGDLMMVIEYCETQTYIERGSAMWDGLANLKRYAAVRARTTPQQAVPTLTAEQRWMEKQAFNEWYNAKLAQGIHPF